MLTSLSAYLSLPIPFRRRPEPRVAAHQGLRHDFAGDLAVLGLDAELVNQQPLKLGQVPKRQAAGRPLQQWPAIGYRSVSPQPPNPVHIDQNPCARRSQHLSVCGNGVLSSTKNKKYQYFRKDLRVILRKIPKCRRNLLGRERSRREHDDPDMQAQEMAALLGHSGSQSI